MKIKLDDKHILCSEENCCWIVRIVTPEKSKPYEKRVSGYVPTFSMAVETYINKSINSLETTEIQQLKDKVDSLIKEVRAWKVKLPDAK